MISPRKGPVMQKSLPCHDIIMLEMSHLSMQALRYSHQLSGAHVCHDFRHLGRLMISFQLQYLQPESLLGDISAALKVLARHFDLWCPETCKPVVEHALYYKGIVIAHPHIPTKLTAITNSHTLRYYIIRLCPCTYYKYVHQYLKLFLIKFGQWHLVLAARDEHTRW